MPNIIEYLDGLCVRLEAAGIEKDEACIALTSGQEQALLDHFGALVGLRHLTAHHAEYEGWRIIVKGVK